MLKKTDTFEDICFLWGCFRNILFYSITYIHCYWKATKLSLIQSIASSIFLTVKAGFILIGGGKVYRTKSQWDILLRHFNKLIKKGSLNRIDSPVTVRLHLTVMILTKKIFSFLITVSFHILNAFKIYLSKEFFNIIISFADPIFS